MLGLFSAAGRASNVVRSILLADIQLKCRHGGEEIVNIYQTPQGSSEMTSGPTGALGMAQLSPREFKNVININFKNASDFQKFQPDNLPKHGPGSL